MFRDVFFVVLIVLGVRQVKSLRLGEKDDSAHRGEKEIPSEHTAGKKTTVQSEADGASECEGRKPQWLQEGPIKRLKGPVFNLHIPGPYHTAGMFVGCLARDIGHMVPHGCTRWADLTDEKKEDLHWVDLEDRLSREHTLDDLGCGTNKSSILSTIVRHPLNMFLHRWFACNDWNKLKHNDSEPCTGDALKADKVCQHNDPVCQLGDEPCKYDNVILQAFAGGDRVKTRADLELAKSRLREFDLIFIVEHFSHTLQLTTTRLGWRPRPLSDALNSTLHKAEEKENQERFTSSGITPEQWQRVIERNSLDIELYDYMRELSFGMLQADGLPVPTEDERAVAPKWDSKVLVSRRAAEAHME